ncbi:MAG: hypothetical protein ACAI44_05810 [Candidatus Sericytochromatia bacterium]
MRSLNRMTLPLLMTCGLCLASPAALAAPTGMPFQIAEAANESLELHKTDRKDGDGNQNGTVDRKDSIGLQSLGDNINDGIDNDDSQDSTFNAVFWVLLGVVLLVVGGFAVYTVRSQQTTR